ncbi:MAG: N-acetylneuraminate synthase family protein [bacterium]
MIDLSRLEFGRPLIIAEIGGNHDGKVERAYRLAKMAAESGADVVKFQAYRADTLVNPRLSMERHRHFRRLELPLDEWFRLAEFVRSLGCHWMVSLWDEEWLEALDPELPAYKVGSGDFTNFSLLDQLVATGKPLILSTAMCDERDVDETVAFLLDRNPEIIKDRRLALLQCTAMYDDPNEEDANLAGMARLRDRYGVVVGYSNHARGPRACIVAAAMGAEIVEAHFTDDKTRPFRDHQLSLTSKEMLQLRAMVDSLPTLRGNPIKTVSQREAANRETFRRGLYPRRDLPAGRVVRAGDLVALRPNVGIDARKYFRLIGTRLRRDVSALEPLREDEFELPE